jgi:glycosyltransferase involved in cell wall biosynthesis
MAKVDLHVHSCYSDHPSEWFLQRLGANESYTNPETVYAAAKAQGMDFVTLTDHNDIRGALALRERHPDDTFISVEATCYFPEDGCKVHILVYDLDQAAFAELERIRTDIYAVRDFLAARNLAHAVAHATYAVNDKLTRAHLEKLILLFNVFEGINGSRARASNAGWMAVLGALTPEHLAALQLRHGIAPTGATPWRKSCTAGSDDHAGLFIGHTWTEAAGATPAAFVATVRAGHSQPAGRHNDYRTLAFALYKIAYDFSRARGGKSSGSLLAQLTEIIFGRGSLSLRNRLRMQKIRAFRQPNEVTLHERIVAMIDVVQANRHLPVDARFTLVYRNLAGVVDTFFVLFASALARSLKDGDVIGIVQNLATSLPGVFLSIPFFSTLHHMCQGRPLLNEMLNEYQPAAAQTAKRVLWFTDTLTDLNGVAVMLHAIAHAAGNVQHTVRMVTAAPPGQVSEKHVPNLLVLPSVYEFPLPHYEIFAVRVPSLLQSLELLCNFEPDEIVISTPGPVGLLGLVLGRLLKVKSTGIYHTDFVAQAGTIIDDDSLIMLCDSVTRWFFTAMDEVRVPTQEYIRILEARGFERRRLRLLPAAVATNVFYPRHNARQRVQERHGVPDGVTLGYVGRLAQDKNLDFLAEVYLALCHRCPAVNLLIVGEGPHAATLQARLAGAPRVRFIGAVAHQQLPEFYSACDFFLFPSVADTFGMAVLEAQACGVPALVSDKGGPQEIVVHGVTGAVVPVDAAEHWVRHLEELIRMLHDNPAAHVAMRTEARQRALAYGSWEAVLEALFGRVPRSSPPHPAAAAPAACRAGHAMA